jgi:hypothetical protein
MELVENVYVSDFTKSTLGQFGWKEGDAIPADLGQVMIKMKETLPTSKRTDVLIDKDTMTEEQVTQIKDMLRAARDLGVKKKREEEIEEQAQKMAPDVAEVYKQLETAEPMIVDDRAAAEKQPEPRSEEDTSPSRQKNDAVKEEEEKENTNELPQTTTDPAAVSFCPRCGWDLRQKFEVVPTDRDKEDFLATLLGGTRFKKKYELFGGRIVVTFRSLLAEENKLIYRQLVLDQQENRVATEAEWFVQMMDYRLACSLETITDKAGKVISAIPTLDEMPLPPNPEKPLATTLPQQLALINKNLAQEATRRLVGTHLRQFQRLVESLEAMALEPNFWNGIE